MTKEKAKGYVQFILIIVFLVSIYFLNFGLQLVKTEPTINNQVAEIPIVEAVTVSSVMKKITFTDTAQIIPRSYVPIVPEITGRILKVSPNFKVGSCFTKNQLLFTIDTDDVQAEYKTALAEIQQAKANLSLVQAEAQAAIAEWKILNPTVTIPPLVAKQPQINQAQATIETAQARTKLAHIRLQNSEFSYPFSGCVESSQVEVGQFATRGQSLGQVFSSDALEIIVNLPADKADRLKKTPYNAEMVIDNVIYKANIDRIADVIDSQTQFSKIILKSETTENLQPNKIAKITFYTKQPEKVFIIHDTDIVNNNQIRLINDDNTITLHDIHIIARTDKEIYIEAFDTEIKMVRGDTVKLDNNMTVKIANQ